MTFLEDSQAQKFSKFQNLSFVKNIFQLSFPSYSVVFTVLNAVLQCAFGLRRDVQTIGFSWLI